MSVTSKDHGARAMLQRISRKRPTVRVGIFGEAAAAKANDAPGATVGQIAAAHEFGIGVPRRSWMNDTINASAPAILEGLRKSARAVLDTKANARAGAEVQALAQAGQYIAGLMRQRISAGISPALTPAYLKRKLVRYPGATTPLIASGQMWGAIGSEVEGSAETRATARANARKAAKKVLARRRAQARANKRARALARVGRKVVRTASRLEKRLTRRANKFAKAVRKRGRALRKRARKAFR